MIRKALLMRVYPGHETDYQARHNPIWPELEKVYKEHGVRSYSIYRHDLELFCYLELESEERWNALMEEEVMHRWWQHMAPIMQSHPDGSPVVFDLPEVFHLE